VRRCDVSAGSRVPFTIRKPTSLPSGSVVIAPISVAAAPAAAGLADAIRLLDRPAAKRKFEDVMETGVRKVDG
jgi:hypothetical protein